MRDLQHLGWNSSRESEIDPSLRPARVAAVGRDHYLVLGDQPPAWVSCAGRLLHRATDATELPAVGDWVAVRDRVIHRVLSRTSCLVRRSVGNAATAQVICANVDTVFVMAAAGADLNVRRLERYMSAVFAAGARPVVVVNKLDLAGDLAVLRAELAELEAAAELIFISALDGIGVDDPALSRYLAPGNTVAMVGSSGVGKSTLANRLLGEDRLATAAVRDADDKGRHTTTRRELMPLPGGALLIDTPGMRELGLWQANDGLELTFADVEELAVRCRFRDCLHDGEPGCAVQDAVASGALDDERLAHYHKLQRELAHDARRVDERAQRDHHEQWKSVTRSMRERRRLNRKLGLKDV